MTDRDSYKRGLDFALRSLTRKEQPSFQIRKKLKEREIDSEASERVIAQCIAWNFINDERWLENYVNGQKLKKRGAKRIFLELLRQGVNKETALEALGRLVHEEDSREGIRELLSTKYKKFDLKDRKQRQKVIASLFRRGYSWDEIISQLE